MLGAHGWGFAAFCSGTVVVLFVLIGVPVLIIRKVKAAKAARAAEEAAKEEK